MGYVSQFLSTKYEYLIRDQLVLETLVSSKDQSTLCIYHSLSGVFNKCSSSVPTHGGQQQL